MKYEVDNLRFIFYTNQTNTHLGEYAVHYFLKYNNLDDIKVSLVSNKFLPDHEFLFKGKADYFDADVDFAAGGKHFGETMYRFLSQIDEEYVVILCDDYFFIREIKWDQLKDLMKFIEDNDVDYFGFDDVMDAELAKMTPYDGDCPDILKDNLYYRNHDYKYALSIQACIWKRTELLKIVENYKPMSAHCLDETRPDIREATRHLKCLYNTLHSGFTDWEIQYPEPRDRPDIIHYDYYVLAYVEVARHGVFLLSENGWGIPQQCRNKFLEAFISEFNILDNPKFRRLLEHRHPLGRP